MFRFTIRDVLWLTVVVAIAAGWLVDHARQVGRYNLLLDKTFQIEINGGVIPNQHERPYTW